MKRRIPGLRQTTLSSNDVEDGVYLVRVERVHYRSDKQKPYFTLGLTVLEPSSAEGRTLSGRLYCTPKALWKLSWFLRDFGYDPELFGREEIDERAVVNLTGVVNVSHSLVQGRAYLNLEGFAPASQWPELMGSLRTKEAA